NIKSESLKVLGKSRSVGKVTFQVVFPRHPLGLNSPTPSNTYVGRVDASTTLLQNGLPTKPTRRPIPQRALCQHLATKLASNHLCSKDTYTQKRITQGVSLTLVPVRVKRIHCSDMQVRFISSKHAIYAGIYFRDT